MDSSGMSTRQEPSVSRPQDGQPIPRDAAVQEILHATVAVLRTADSLQHRDFLSAQMEVAALREILARVDALLAEVEGPRLGEADLATWSARLRGQARKLELMVAARKTPHEFSESAEKTSP